MKIASRTENPIKLAKSDRLEAYCRMYDERAERYLAGDIDMLSSLAFAAIRVFSLIRLKEMDWSKAYLFEQVTNGLLADLTPRQLLNTFPPSKDFNGEKWQVKDYFTTMEAVRAYPLDEPIGAGKIFNLLWDYMNPDTMNYMVQRMGVVDLFLKSQGKPSAMETFLAEQGITPKYLQTGPGGKEYLYDPDTDTTTRVYPKKPFKIVSRRN